MANAYSTSDLIKGALQNAGELPNSTSQYAQLALKYINETYHSVLSGSNEIDPEIGDAWVWARSSASFVLQPFTQNGAITIANGSTSGTFSIAPTSSLAGWHIQSSNTAYPTWYIISAHAANSTSFTLSTAFADPSVTAGNFLACQLIYDLCTLAAPKNGILRLVEPLRQYFDRKVENMENLYDQDKIYSLELDKFREIYPLRYLRNDQPSRFTTLTRSDTSWQVQFNAYPTNAVKVDFDYIAIQDDLIDSDQSIPVFPREFRSLLEYWASHKLCIDKSMTEKAQYYAGLSKAKLMAMHLAENKNVDVANRTFARLVPRPDNQRWKIRI